MGAHGAHGPRGPMGPKPAGRGGARRAGGGGRPAPQLNLVSYVIGTFFFTKSNSFVSDAHIYIQRERLRESSPIPFLEGWCVLTVIFWYASTEGGCCSRKYASLFDTPQLMMAVKSLDEIYKCFSLSLSLSLCRRERKRARQKYIQKAEHTQNIS